MFAGKNTIILGAGASADFGLPLGNELFSIIRDDCAHLLRVLEAENPNLILGLRESAHFADHPLGYLLFHQGVRELGDRFTKTAERFPWLKEQLAGIERLRKLLDRTTAETIDEFVTLHPSNADLCLRLIASAMFRRIYRREQNKYSRQDFFTRYVQNKERNWIHLFINTFRTNRIRGKNLTDRVRIVSFNYDPIFRIALDELLDASEVPLGDWRQYFEVYQVYGEFASCPVEVVDVAETVFGWASGITTVGLRREGFPLSTLNNVKSAVIGSDVLSVAGFAFARDNCELERDDFRFGRILS